MDGPPKEKFGDKNATGVERSGRIRVHPQQPGGRGGEEQRIDEIETATEGTEGGPGILHAGLSLQQRFGEVTEHASRTDEHPMNDPTTVRLGAPAIGRREHNTERDEHEVGLPARSCCVF
jgi:hypothetical protein